MDDAADHGIKVFQDLSGGNAERLKADLGEALIPNSVALRPVAPVMELAVHFDRKACRETGEVEAIANLRVLAPEEKAAWFLPQCLPEQDFRE